MRKINYFILLITGMILMLSSCLGSDKEETFEDWNYSNALISSFSLSSDSVSALSKVIFTIDQLNNKIFNKDSMPFGTKINQKVVAQINKEIISNPFPPLIIDAKGDSVRWMSSSDSIDISAPITITIFSYSGIISKIYDVRLNIHQVDPDSMVWNKSNLIADKVFDNMQIISSGNNYYMFTKEGSQFKLYKSNIDNIAWSEQNSDIPANAVIEQITEYENAFYMPSSDGKLYSSSDASNWTITANAPKIKAILGHLPFSNTNRASTLSAIIESNGELRFAVMNKDLGWVEGDVVPDGFPVSGFGKINYENRYYPREVVICGRDKSNKLTGSVWATMNGRDWAKTSSKDKELMPCDNAIVAYYDSCFYVIGGFDEFGIATDKAYKSIDQGITWSDTVKMSFPQDFDNRGYSSAIVNKDYLLLFGGKANKNAKVMNEIWSGRINRLGFK